MRMRFDNDSKPRGVVASAASLLVARREADEAQGPVRAPVGLDGLHRAVRAAWVAAWAPVHRGGLSARRCQVLRPVALRVEEVEPHRRSVVSGGCPRKLCWRCRGRNSCVGQQPAGRWIAIPVKSLPISGF